MHMEIEPAIPRKIGTVLELEDKSCQYMVRNIKIIQEAVKNHGVIVIRNVNLDSEQILELTKAFGDEVVHLPAEMRRLNVDKEHPEVVRIGNILPDGSKIDAQKDGSTWHQDGALYCQHHMMRIITMLHPKIIPESGGATEFLDLQEGWEYLKRSEPILA